MVGETSEPQVDEQPELVVNAPGDTWPTVNTAYDPEAGLEPTPEEKAPEA
jgi:hypothetical protein